MDELVKAVASTPQLDFKEMQFPLGRLTLAAKAWGNADGYPVLALHGWMDNANSFEKVTTHLHGIHLVALDMAGHGKSDHRGSGMPYHVWEYVLDAIDVVDLLGWKRFGILGHSLGGGVAALVAGTIPESVERAVLIENIGPATAEPDAFAENLLRARKSMQTFAKTKERRAKHDGPRFTHLDQAVERRLQGRLKLNREAAEALIDRGTHPVDGGYDWSHDLTLTLPSAVRLTEAQVQELVKRIDAPTDVIIGDDGFFIQGKGAEQVDQRLPLFKSAQKHVLPGGHHLHMENGAASVAKIVMNAFKRP